jgi:hypothetical protein
MSLIPFNDSGQWDVILYVFFAHLTRSDRKTGQFASGSGSIRPIFASNDSSKQCTRTEHVGTRVQSTRKSYTNAADRPYLFDMWTIYLTGKRFLERRVCGIQVFGHEGCRLFQVVGVC